MRLRAARARVAVGADVGLGGDVANGVVGEGLGERRGAQRHGGGGQPVEAVVAEALGEAGVGIAACEQLAERVIRITKARHRAGRPGRDARQQARVGIEGLAGDDACLRITLALLSSRP